MQKYRLPAIFLILFCFVILLTFQNCSGEKKLQTGASILPSTPDAFIPNIQVAAGALSTCAIKNQVTYCWGDNTYGQLGDGTKISKSAPTPVLTSLIFKSISVGTDHTCAVAEDTRVYCWGSNNLGQLGNGTLTESLVPVMASNLIQVRKVAAGHRFSCAITDAAMVYCWGNDSIGQLGSAFITNLSTVPVANGVQNAKDISASTGHPNDDNNVGRACVLTARDTVLCWGATYARHPTTGLPTFIYNSTAFTVGGVNGAKNISVSITHICVSLADKTVQCWGNNTFSQMGIVTATNVSSPAGRVTNLINVTAVSVGSQHSCALDELGAVRCWGLNRFITLTENTLGGQLGQDPNQFDSLLLPATLSTQNVYALESGHSHTCVNVDDMAVYCFGYNGSGQLGVNGMVQSHVPQLVPLP